RLFVEKLRTCSIIYDFMENTNLENKMCKKQIMSEILEYLIHGRNVLTPELYREIVDMVSKNIFRKLPSSEIMFDVEEDHTFYDPSWPHLLLSYEILTQFLYLPDFKTSLARHYINENFIDQFMDLFLTRDGRERVTLQKILLKIYRAFIVLRPYIRNRFYEYTFDEVYVIGLPDLMQFYSNIIPGFVFPLEAEHEIFFTNIFLLLHCGAMYPHYYKRYLDCIYELLLKNPKLYEKVVDVIIKYWPKTSSAKQLLFLKELNDLLTDIKSEEFEVICIDLFTLLADCFSKPNYYVFDGALDVLNNPTICSLIKTYTDTVYPIIVPVLLKSMEAIHVPNKVKIQAIITKFRNDSEKDFSFSLLKYEE
ncbi:hypothetical protein HELRODRAFT_65543, partial [Helobdella robusta]|uniref:Uncharacterized protein n=1 Tax=Helobdella robusta TaxID=6412 RepID=T1FY92_HELRO